MTLGGRQQVLRNGAEISVIHLRTLGRFELVAGEAPAIRVVAAQPKRLALLAYLALGSPTGAHRRDSLLALFWPELNTEESRRALRQALHAIRQVLDEGALESRRDDQVAIASDRGWCDVVAFERALEAQQLEVALALYQGPFLGGVFISDVSADFEQWVGNTRSRLSTSAMHAATKLASLAHAHGDNAAEIRWATTACRLAPDDEASVRLLMQALADAGDRPQALRVFETFRARLLSELGAKPARETAALATTLQAAPSRAAAVVHEGIAANADELQPPDAVHATVRVQTSAHGPANRPFPPKQWLIFAGIAAALALSARWYVFRESRLDSAGAADRILIADFQNATHDSLLATAVTEALRADFSQSRRAHILSRTQVQSALQRMQQPGSAILSEALVREMAEREGVKAFVTGEIAALGKGFSVSAVLVSVVHGDVLASVREVAPDSTGLIAAVDRVSSALRRGTGESLWAVRASPSLEQVTTSSLEALRLYSQAVKVGDQDGDRAGAIQLLQQAVARDTMFAMAWRKLGAYLGGIRAQAGADDAMRHALRYSDRLPVAERYLTLGAYYDQTGLPDSALVAYRALLQLDPRNTVALNNTAAQYITLHDFHKAEQFRRRALETDSSMSVLYTNLANDQLNSGELDDVEQTLSARSHRFAPQPDSDVLRISLAMARGQFADAEQLTRMLLADAGTDLDRQSSPLRMLALEVMLAGRLSEAEQLMHRYMDGQATLASPSGYVEGAILLAFEQVEYRHDAVRSVKVVDDALARFPLGKIPALDRPYAFLAYVLALADEPARSRALLATFRANDATTAGSSAIRDEGDYLRAEGAAFMAEHRYADAIASLVRAGTAMNNYVCPVCALPDLANAYDKANQPDSAIAVYRRYVTTPWSDWMTSNGEFRSLAWRRLGELYEMQGDTRRAILALQTVAGLWEHADASVQPDLADVRARLVRLRALVSH